MIKSDSERAIDAALKEALEARLWIERFMFRHPEFRCSLEPLDLDTCGSHRVVDLMLKAARLTGVGPFAAVAGAIAQVAAEVAMDAGARNVLVDNGGDISIIGDREFRVGIYAGRAPISGKICFLVRAGDLPIGICTSSGTVGHSMSFGWADAVVAIASEASIADAAATSIANAVRGANAEASINQALIRAAAIPEIRGCLVARGDHVGIFGKLPKLIPCSLNGEEIINRLEYRTRQVIDIETGSNRYNLPISA